MQGSGRMRFGVAPSRLMLFNSLITILEALRTVCRNCLKWPCERFEKQADLKHIVSERCLQALEYLKRKI